MTSLSIFLVKWILAAVLVTAGTAKLIVPEESSKPKRQRNIGNNKTVSKLVLPVFEIITAVLLLIPVTSKIGFITSTLLFGIFLMIIFHNLSQKKETPCGCFGRLSRTPVNRLTVLRTASFFLASATSAFVILEVMQSNSTLSIVPVLIAVFSAVIGTILSLKELTSKAEEKSSGSVQANLLSRREALKGLGAIAASMLALGVHRKQAAASSCCYCQYYDHFEPGCFDPYNEKRTKHYFRRCCNTCTGANGYWRKYQPDGCVYACGCYQTCDVLYSCTGSSCHCNDCGCCV